MRRLKRVYDEVRPLAEPLDAYMVGGTVRDTILGVEPVDIDLTTPYQIVDVESKLRSSSLETWRIEKDPQVVGVKYLGRKVEIATFRGQTIEEDLEHRDFTINSIAVGEKGLVDPYRGVDDISNRLIRSSSPHSRFGEDPLRMLRAIRFISTLGFRIEDSTRNTIVEYAHSILNTARERRFSELTKLLVGKHVKPALELLFQTRLLGYVLPELYPITMLQRTEINNTKDLWYHTKVVVNKSVARPVVRWAALLHDIAKPQTMLKLDKVHFLQHDFLGAELVDGLLRRLKSSASFRESVKGLVALHQRVGDVVSRRNNPPVSINALRRLARDCDDRRCSLDDLIELFAADCSSGRREVVERQRAHAELLRSALADMREEDLRPKLPKGIGQSIIDHFKLRPGPEVGVIRKRLEELLINGLISNDMTHLEMFEIMEENDV